MSTNQTNKLSYKKLSEVCDFKGGGTPSKQEPAYWNGNIPWASVKDIKSSSLETTQDKISKLGLNNSAASLAKPGDLILITRISPGKSTISKIEVAINQDLKIVSPKTKISSKFLHYFFQSIERQIQDLSSGTTVLGITLNSLNEIPFPDIEYEKQISIVSKIEELFSELDKGIENLKLAQQQLKVYRQSVLKWAFEGRLTNEDVKEGELPEGWKIKRLGDVTLNLDGKRRPLSKTVRAKRKGIYRYYGATEIVDYIDDFLFDGIYLLIGEDGANLLSKSRPLAFLVEGKFWVNNHAHVLQSKSDLHLKYLCYYFNSLNLAQFVTGSAQPKLTQANLNKIEIPVAPILEQNSIVTHLDDSFSLADKMEESINQSLRQAEVMRQSILKRAFEGKINILEG